MNTIRPEDKYSDGRTAIPKCRHISKKDFYFSSGHLTHLQRLQTFNVLHYASSFWNFEGKGDPKGPKTIPACSDWQLCHSNSLASCQAVGVAMQKRFPWQHWFRRLGVWELASAEADQCWLKSLILPDGWGGGRKSPAYQRVFIFSLKHCDMLATCSGNKIRE